MRPQMPPQMSKNTVWGRALGLSGATAARAHSLTFYAPPRDSIAIPASLMWGENVRGPGFVEPEWPTVIDSTSSQSWKIEGPVCFKGTSLLGRVSHFCSNLFNEIVQALWPRLGGAQARVQAA